VPVVGVDAIFHESSLFSCLLDSPRLLAAYMVPRSGGTLRGVGSWFGQREAGADAAAGGGWAVPAPARPADAHAC